MGTEEKPQRKRVLNHAKMLKKTDKRANSFNNPGERS